MVDHQFQYSEQNDIPIPQTIGDYRVMEFVSRDTGSQGSVYKAIGPDDTLVAVKVIGNSFESYSHSLIAALIGEDDLEALKREADILGKLNHSNIIKLLNTGEDSECGTYIVMEWMSGGNLRKMLDQYPGKKLPIVIATDIAFKILGAIEEAHNVGITHLDIKPENILLAEDGAVKLSDFGIAGNNRDKVLVGRGTEGYMAPEQIDISKINMIGPRTDIYSVGILLLEMLTGHLPTEEHTIEDIIKEVPLNLKTFINCAIEKSPDLRFSSATEALSHIVTIE